MTRNAVQEERIRGFFIDAAKEIIRGEGVEAVSARSVAERAGYSYATLYNYFKDIRDLVFCCVDGFLGECRQSIESAPASKRANLQGVTRLYVSFMVQYPGIFELLFLQKPSAISTQPSDLEKINLFFDTLTGACWDQIQSEKKLADEAVAQARLAHAAAVHGLLLMYLNRRTNVSFKAFMWMVESVSDVCRL
ncbi:MAG: TetR/AcrR family transcriptional regulator [Spirochaetota bacterium]